MAAGGAATLALAIYLFDRQPETIYLIPGWFTLKNNVHPFFGTAGNYLPSFFHVYVFILLTVLTLNSLTLRRILVVCIAWFALDSLLEIGQIAELARLIAGIVPTWFNDWPFLENVSAYFINGTFDYRDLVSITVGTFAAFFTIQTIYRKESKNSSCGSYHIRIASFNQARRT